MISVLPIYNQNIIRNIPSKNRTINFVKHNSNCKPLKFSNRVPVHQRSTILIKKNSIKHSIHTKKSLNILNATAIKYQDLHPLDMMLYKTPEDVSTKSDKNNIFSSLPFFNFYHDFKNKNYQSLLVDFLKGLVNSVSPINHNVVKNIPNPITLIKDNLDGTQFINTSHRSINIIKNVLFFSPTIKKFFQEDVYNTVVNSKISEYFLKYKNILQFVRKKVSSNIETYFNTFHLENPFVSFNKYTTYENNATKTLKNNFNMVADCNMQNIKWIHLNSMNKVYNTNFLSKSLFNKAKDKNLKFDNQKISASEITINGENIPYQTHKKFFNNLQKKISDGFLKKLLLVCLKEDLTTHPYFEIFSKTKEISKFHPKKISTYYSINNLKKDKIEFTVTELGNFNKISTQNPSKNYTDFGVRTSMILSKNKLPKIKYFNFIK